MRNQTIKLVYFGILLLQLIGCSGEDSSVEKATDPYITDLKEMLPEVNTSVGNPSVSFSILQPRRIRPLEDGNFFTVIDGADKSIVLINKEGKLLSEAGGEGRGPGEFQNISQLHIGDDGRIYLLDMLSFRITVYEATDGALKYIEAISYNNPPNYSLRRIYVTKFGNYGVYNHTEGFQTPDNRFLLYSLDEKFTPVKKLLEMPGTEREKVVNPGGTLYMPNVILNRTFWDVDGEWFYFIRSHESSINTYNLRNGTRELISYFQLPERVKADNHKTFLKERYGIEAYEDQWSVIEEVNTFPLFSGFWVQDDKIILRISYPAQQEGIMIYIDQHSEEVAYFQTPYELAQISIHGDKIYGFDFSISSDNQVVCINLDRNSYP